MAEISKEKFKKAVDWHKAKGFIICADDLSDAFDVVYELLRGEADALHESGFERAADRLEQAAHEVYMLVDEYDELWEEVYGND